VGISTPSIMILILGIAAILVPLLVGL
jgi:hypothetical protein